MMSKDRRKFPSTSFPIVLHVNCCSAIIELNLAISLRKMIGVRNLISWIMNNLLLTIIIPRGTMYVDSPLAKFTKSDGILSLMHCQEWNSVSFIRMDFSELSSTWNVLVGKLTHIGNILGLSPSVIFGNKIQKLFSANYRQL